MPITPATLGPIACISRKFVESASAPTFCETLAAIGTAETPADPISGFTFPPVILHISLPKRTPDAVPNANATRRNLLRAISHDLRTPLSAIMGSSEILMQMCKEDAMAYNIAEGIYQDTDWLYALVENILSLTRLQQDNLALKKQSEVLEEVVGAAIATIEKRMPNRQIEVQMPENLILVDINASLIHQVLIKLLDNAIKHSEDNTKITLQVVEKEKFVYVSVIDEGCGIAQNDLQNIFQMFYTTRGKCVDSKRGIGLGLSICQTIVEAHGGKIFAQNRSDRQGAIFSFSLPLEEVEHGNDFDSGR